MNEHQFSVERGGDIRGTDDVGLPLPGEIERCDDPPNRHRIRFARRAPLEGGIANTGTVTRPRICSVVDPKNTFLSPLSPCVPITTRSLRRRLAARRISSAGLPVTTTIAILFAVRGAVAIVCLTNRASSTRVRSTNWRRPPDVLLAAARRSGSLTNITVTRPPNRCAVATACRSAARECVEKSTGHRMDRNVVAGVRFMRATSSHLLGLAGAKKSRGTSREQLNRARLPRLGAGVADGLPSQSTLAAGPRPAARDAKRSIAVRTLGLWFICVRLSRAGPVRRDLWFARVATNGKDVPAELRVGRRPLSGRSAPALSPDEETGIEAALRVVPSGARR